MPEHTQIEPLLASYALGALSDAEMADVEEHLAGCADCRAELDSLLRLNACVGLAAPQVDPPPDLRDRIMTLVTSEATQRLQRGVAPAPIPISRWRRSGGVPVYWAAVAAVLPLAVCAWLALQVVTLRTSMSNMQSAAHDAWSNAESVTDIMGRGIVVGAGHAEVEPTDLAPTAGGMLYYLPTHQDGVLVVDGLPALPPGQCYQVWLISGDHWMSGGTFYLGGDGKGITTVRSPMPLSDIDTVRVTMEPHGGSDRPGDKRYLWARLSQT